MLALLPLLAATAAAFGIHPNGDTYWCLDAAKGALQDGTRVQIYECNGTPAQDWGVLSISTDIFFWLGGSAEERFCLTRRADANGAGVFLRSCGGENQTWALDYGRQAWALDNGRFIDSAGQCLDLRDGQKQNWNKVQTWQCYDGNKNQQWSY